MKALSSIFLLTLCLNELIVKSSTENILGLFPHFGYSHFKVFYPILDGLVQSGHNVTVVTYTKNPKPHSNYHELLLTGSDTLNVFPLLDDFFTRSLKTLYSEFWILHEEGQNSCKDFFSSGYVEKILSWHKHAPFDLVISEYFNTDCYLALPQLLEVPVVALSSCALMPWYYDRIRLPDIPSYIQSEFIGFPEELNFSQRLLNYGQAKLLPILYRFFTNSKDNELIKRYLNVNMNVAQIAKERTSLILVNQHYTLSGPRALTPQLIEIGGIHIDKSELNVTLSKEIELFLNDLKPQEKVLYISWGSMIRASSMNQKTLSHIIEILKNLPIKIIWKWESDEIPIKSKQFLFVKWAPQTTLLCHPRINYFWSHGGLLGTTEGVYCGKPMIITPVYGDQFLNGHAVQNRKVGIILEYKEIEDKLKECLEKFLDNRFTEKAQMLSKVFRDRDILPLNKALWSIEHLLKHGPIATELLRTKAVHLEWYIYSSLDVITLILLALFGIFWIFKCIMNFFSNTQYQNVKKKKN